MSIENELVTYKKKISENADDILKLFDDLQDAAARHNLSKCEKLVQKISVMEINNHKLHMMIDELLTVSDNAEATKDTEGS